MSWPTCKGLLAVSPVIAVLSVTMVGVLYALTYPVQFTGNPRAAATFVEDHAEWHAGVDIPRSNGVRVVRAAATSKLFSVWTAPAPTTVQSVVHENSTVLGQWQILLTKPDAKFMCDIISVSRVTIGKPVATYTVQNVVESPIGSGFTDNRVNLVPNMPTAGDFLVPGDSLDVSYAYYFYRIEQAVFDKPGGGEFYWYGHIDSLDHVIDWNAYPATNTNRFYGPDTGVPTGRDTFEVAEGSDFAIIEALHTFASEPHHLHFSTTGDFNFPNTATNPLGRGRFADNDPQNNRPIVRSIGLTRVNMATLFPDSTIYGGVDVFAESRDDMGAPEVADDGDGGANVVRETGAYNAGYWVTAQGTGAAGVASAADPNTMFSGAGKDSISGTDPLSTVLRRGAPFQIDINTNYHQWVSHVHEDSTRYWNTRARSIAARNDGSDGPGARDNSEAKFRDGRYTIRAKARDVIGYGAQRDSAVAVDNFRPYVRKVVVKDGANEIYRAEWRFNSFQILLMPSTPDSGMLDASGKKRCADGTNDVTIEVTFSEAMDQAQITSITPLGYVPALAREPAGQDTVWKATIPVAQISTSGLKTGKQIISITGRDWANNQIRAITSAAPIDTSDNMRNAAGVMQGPGGTDKLHRFAICQAMTFIIDDTGSMYEEIGGVKASVINLIDANTVDSTRYVKYYVVTFKDGVTFRGASTDPDIIKPIINALDASGGGNCPEASVEALATVPGHMPRGGLAMFATDADPSAGGAALSAAIASLQAAMVQVNTLISGTCAGGGAEASGIAPAGIEAQGTSDNGPDAFIDQPPGQKPPASGSLVALGLSSSYAFSRVANETGGLYFFIPNYDFETALDIVIEQFDAGALLCGRSADVDSTDVTYDAPVDASVTTAYFTLNTTAGGPLDFTVRRPSGATISDIDPDVTLISSASVTSYRVDAPATGNWTAEVSGSGTFGFRATAESPRTLLLTSGFSIPMDETSPVSTQFLGSGVLGTSFTIHSPAGDSLGAADFYDDGMHGDGTAGDGVYGGSILPPLVDALRLTADGTDGPESFHRESVQTLFVSAPDIDVPRTAWDFGMVAVGDTATTGIAVRNAGQLPLMVSSISSDAPAFSADSTSLLVAPYDQRILTVRFAPDAADTFLAALTLVSNDPDEDTVHVSLAGVAVPPPDIGVEPDTVFAAASLGDADTSAVTVHNSGPGSLGFVLVQGGGDSFQAAPGASVRNRLSSTSSGGPDTSGYRWIDSGDSGVPIQWEDIDATGADLTLQDDEAQGPFPIGFDFPFYGQATTQFYVASNGFITLDAYSGSSPINSCLPAIYAPNNIVAFLWIDLDPSLGGRVLYQSDGKRLVVTYEDIQSSSGGTPSTCQVVLYADGLILMNYREVEPRSAVAGIQNADGSAGLTAYCRDGVHPAAWSTLYFYQSCPWLAVPASSGTVASGDSSIVDLIFSADQFGMTAGTVYRCDLTFLSNDPDEPQVMVPALFTVGEAHNRISGLVTSLATGLPEPGAVVTCTGVVGTYADTTDAGGAYDIAKLPSGSYSCEAAAAGYLNTGSFVVTIPPDTTLDFALTRPVFDAHPPELDVIVASGDSMACFPLTILNIGTAPLTFNSYSSETSSPAPSMLQVPATQEAARVSPSGIQPLRAPTRVAATEPELALDFGLGTASAGCAWLSQSPDSETVAPSDSITVQVCIDASGLPDTTLFCELVFLSNDPQQPMVTVPVDVTVGTAGGVGPDPGIPPRFVLLQNRPNPFFPSTHILFGLQEQGPVRLQIFDLSGRLVAMLVDERLPAGFHEVEWGGTDEADRRVLSGIYFYRLEAGGRVAVRKMLLLR